MQSLLLNIKPLITYNISIYSHIYHLSEYSSQHFNNFFENLNIAVHLAVEIHFHLILKIMINYFHIQ